MKTTRTHKDLNVWQLSMDFVIHVYSVTRKFPIPERYGLTQQIRKAAVSIPSNLAEGAARKNTREMIQFLYIALGSMAELETQLELADRLGYLEEKKKLECNLAAIGRMTINLIRSLKARSETH